MLKVRNFFCFEFLNFFLMLVLLLLVLRMLEGTCVVTFLPTNNAKIGGAEKSETKRGVTYSGIGFKALFFFFSFSFFFFLSRTKTPNS